MTPPNGGRPPADDRGAASVRRLGGGSNDCEGSSLSDRCIGNDAVTADAWAAWCLAGAR